MLLPVQARTRASAHLQATQAAAEDARAGLQAAQQERILLHSQLTCLRAELDRTQAQQAAGEQARRPLPMLEFTMHNHTLSVPTQMPGIELLRRLVPAMA